MFHIWRKLRIWRVEVIHILHLALWRLSSVLIMRSTIMLRSLILWSLFSWWDTSTDAILIMIGFHGDYILNFIESFISIVSCLHINHHSIYKIVLFSLKISFFMLFLPLYIHSGLLTSSLNQVILFIFL